MLAASVLHAKVLTPSALNTALGSATQASLVSLSGVDPLSCPQVSMTQTWSGGKLIFSDSPESPTMRGMLYIDTNLTATTAGVPNRILSYHVNSNSVQHLKFTVLIKNQGSSAGTLTVLQSGIAGPSTDYPYVGEVAFNRWLTNAAKSGVTVPAGATVRLDSSFDTLSVAQNFLLHGIWDYTFTQPHTVMICALNSADDPVTVGPTLALLARDVHVRGTFSSCNKIYNTATNVVIDTAAGMQQFPIAGNGDAYITGFDYAVSPPTAETDGGNYGVLYNISLGASASDGQALGFLFTPRAGFWSGAVSAPAGLLAGGAFLMPADGSSFSDETQAAVGGEYSPTSTRTNIALQFMPAGGSSFPIRLLTVPFAAIKPSLAPIANRTVNAGQMVTFTATATDANTNKTLTFSLPNGPVGASIGPSNGFFQWRPPVSSAGTTSVVQVTVADNSTPPLTASRSFLIQVNSLSPVTVSPLTKTSSQLQLQVTGPIGPDYILQGNLTLTNQVGWTNLFTNTPAASPFTFTDTNIATFSNQYYRVRLGP